MNLSELIKEDLVAFDLDAADKEDAIRKICRMMYDSGNVTDYEKYVKGVKARELECETGMGGGIAIPHCKSDCVKDAAFTLVSLKHPVEWGSLDGEPVDYVIMLAAPDSSKNVHLKLLSELAVKLMDDDFREGLKKAANIEEVRNIFKDKKED